MKNDAVTNMLKGDLKRAKEVYALIDKARALTSEASQLMQQAVHLAENDSYQGVRVYDSQEIKDVQSVLRVAVNRPINHLLIRWTDIVYGRKSTLKDQG